MSADFMKQDCFFFSQSGTRFLSIYNVCACFYLYCFIAPYISQCKYYCKFNCIFILVILRAFYVFVMDWVDCNVLEYIFTYTSHCEIPEKKKNLRLVLMMMIPEANPTKTARPSEKRLSQIVFSSIIVYVFCACSRHVCEVFCFSSTVLLIFMYLM